MSATKTMPKGWTWSCSLCPLSGISHLERVAANALLQHYLTAHQIEESA